MRQITPPIVLFSVCQGKESDKDNTIETIRQLRSNEIAYKIVEGVYTHDNGEQVREASFMVILKDGVYDVVESLAKQFNQESILVSDDLRKSKLVYMYDNKEVDLGKFQAVSQEEAENSPAYTYDPIQDLYFICK